MPPFAAHVADIPGLLAAVRQAGQIADDLRATGRVAAADHAGILARHDRLRAHRAGIEVAGIAGDAAARAILRDAVNVALALRDAYAGAGGTDHVLASRCDDLQAEFKPDHPLHGGIGLGDRVSFRVGKRTFEGEVAGFDAADPDRATLAMRGGDAMPAACRWCEHLDSYAGPAAPPARSAR